MSLFRESSKQAGASKVCVHAPEFPFISLRETPKAKTDFFPCDSPTKNNANNPFVEKKPFTPRW